MEIFHWFVNYVSFLTFSRLMTHVYIYIYIYIYMGDPVA